MLGPHAPLPLVASLAGVAEPVRALDEAVKADLLETRETSAPWTLAFPHPLVRAAVYDALGPARRQDLHLAAAALVTDEASVLRHRVAAAAEPDEVLAADLTAFADREARRQSWESAAAHLVSASRLSPDRQQAQRRVLQAVLADHAARRRRDRRRLGRGDRDVCAWPVQGRHSRLVGDGGRRPGRGRASC